MFCSKATKEDFLKIRTRYDNEDFMERISCDITPRSEFDELYSIPGTPKSQSCWLGAMILGQPNILADGPWINLPRIFDRDTMWRAVVVGKEDEIKNDESKHTPWGKIADAMIANNVTFNLFDNIDDPHQQELISDDEWPLLARNTDGHDHFEKNIIPPQDYNSMRSWFGMGSSFTGTGTISTNTQILDLKGR